MMLKCHRLAVFVLGFGFSAVVSMAQPALVPEGEPRLVDVQVRNAGVAANEAGDLLLAYGKDGRLHLQTVAGPAAPAPWQLELDDEGFVPSILGLGLDNSRQGILHWLAESTFPGLPPPPEFRVRRFGAAGELLDEPFPPFEQGAGSPSGLALDEEGDFAFVAPRVLRDPDRLLILRRFARSGEPIDATSIELGSAPPARRVYRPRLAWGAAGQVLAVWTEYFCDGGFCEDLAVRGQLVGADGALLGPQLAIAEGAEGASVVWLPSGRFLVTWHRLGEGSLDMAEPLPFALEARTVADDGSLGPVLRVKPERTGQREAFSEVAAPAVDRLGNVLFAWQDRAAAPGDEWTIFLQLLSPALAPVGGRLELARGDGTSHRSPALAATAPGRFTLGWIEPQEFLAEGIFWTQTFLIAPRRCQPGEARLCLEAARSPALTPLKARRSLP